MAQGYALGAASGINAPTVDVPDLQSVNARLQQAVDNLNNNNGLLSDIIARIYGGAGGTEKDTPRPQAAGLLGSLHRQCEDVEELVTRNRAMIDRLSHLA